ELVSGCIRIGEMERSRGTGASRAQWVRHEKSQLLGLTGAARIVQLEAGRQPVAQQVDGERLDAGAGQALHQAVFVSLVIAAPLLVGLGSPSSGALGLRGAEGV